LKERGLAGVRLIVSDACLGLSESAAEFFPDAAWQRCIVHWYRNIFSHVPSTKVREIAAMLKAIHASEDIVAAREKAVRVVEKLAALRLTRAAELVGAAVEETLTYYAFPEEHWRRIRTNNPLERILREIRRRTRVVGAFPDGQSALNLAAVRSSLSAVMTRRCGIVRASLEVSHDPTAGALFRSLLRWRSRPRCRHVRPRRGLRDLREHALRLRQDGLPSDREEPGFRCACGAPVLPPSVRLREKRVPRRHRWQGFPERA